MPSNSCVIIACAGGRKTTCIVEHALQQANLRILITTYTNENLSQIYATINRIKGFIPPTFSVDTWYSFLLRDFIRPYQNILLDRQVNSIDFQSTPPYVNRQEKPNNYYLNRNNDIYRDRVSDFGFRCNSISGNLTINRLEKIYDYIYIDEMQDLSGWDLDLTKLLIDSKIPVMLVGDPRQSTFQTNNSQKNKNLTLHRWVDSLQNESGCSIEERTDCYRSNQTICDFADDLFPEYPRTTSKNIAQTGHDGIFLIRKEDVPEYVSNFAPIILRWNKVTNTLNFPAMNFGISKGSTFDRVLIFPTKPMKDYINKKDITVLKPKSKSLFYVAVTRARFSVAFVVD